MGVEFTNNFDQVAKQILAEASETMHEALAERVAATARENGMSNADAIEIEVSDDSEGHVDTDRVRARANEILAGE